MKAKPIARPDPAVILRGLKDFQRRTVEHVFERLYGGVNPTHRFLVADEVGLGKTLVARGVTALAIDHLWDSVERIDVVYICSNGDIARQNVRRLNVTDRDDYAMTSRITLMPLEVSGLRQNKLNFVSLTPSTSFDLRSSMGKMEERSLLYCLLKDHWGLHGAAPKNVFQGEAGPDRFRADVGRLRHSDDFDQQLAAAFLARVDRHIELATAGEENLRQRFERCAAAFVRSDSQVSHEGKKARSGLIGELRGLLASACLHALEPDLIILDEFQRFKHLLAGDSAEATFAQELFDYEQHDEKARVLLLSATPYKMYTVDDESDGEQHYADFVQTLKFLLRGDEQALAECEARITAYRRGLEVGSAADRAAGATAVRELEARLRSVMVRTERLAQSADRNGMLVTVPSAMDMHPHEATGFVRLQRVADHVGDASALEYWKSSPWVLSFMEDYKLKTRLNEAIEDPASRAQLARIVGNGASLLLPLADIERYAEVPDGNARLRWLRRQTLDRDQWRLLWMPPALPYYKLAGVFAGAEQAGLTKHLVFSSWHVVPRAVAAMMSYDAERRMITGHDVSATNTPEERKRRRGLLRIYYSDDRWNGLPSFLLLYPSPSLAAAGDLLADAPSTPSSLDEAVAIVRGRVEQLLDALPAGSGTEVDEAWYWLAPVLIDRDNRAASEWLRDEAFETLSDDEDAEGADAEGSSALERAIEYLRLRASAMQLGRRPDDLSDVLARAALAAPGIAAYRALGNLVGSHEAVTERMTAAASVAWSFRSLFNQPETMALIRSLRPAEPYWMRVLEYSADGGLGAVLEEFAHVLRESLGLLDAAPARVVETVGAEMQRGLSIRTSTLSVDSLASRDGDLRRDRDQRMRMRFAMRFGDEQSEGGAIVSRADQVRAAFNSPFWPFVVVTTSVGQEGLDFHLYSHAVVHWNLPSNPVDLEQREGRVHRYKGHAVRKNVARMGGLAVARGSGGDPWDRLFVHAVSQRDPGTTDIVPYWVCSTEGGARIERHVPSLPLSRDRDRLERLRRSLVLYRLVFGQPRQEDLLAHLMKEHDAATVDELVTSLRIDLSPPPRPPTTELTPTS